MTVESLGGSKTVASHAADMSLVERLSNAGRAFGIEGGISSFEEISNGKVNHTFRVDYGIGPEEKGANGCGVGDEGRRAEASVRSYIFQEVNTYVFKRPWEVMSNIDCVTSYMKDVARAQGREVRCLEFLHDVGDGRNFHEEGATFWRVYRYIDSVTYNSSKNLEVVRNAGVAFGSFQRDLMDFDASRLFCTIEDFHNTPRRYERLKADYSDDRLGRASQCKPEVSYLLAMEDKACVLHRLHGEGLIPTRVTHNDTKINNVLFDKDTNRAICVLDLDTIMPGFAGHDFGDAVRSAANSMGSSSLEFDKVRIDMEVYKAFAEGFISQTRDILLPDELSTLADSCLVMTLELASRYVDDFLTGDLYFKAKYPTQNLDRARNLIALAKDMDANMALMHETIDRLL